MILNWSEIISTAKPLKADLQGGNSLAYKVQINEENYFLKIYKDRNKQKLRREYRSISILNRFQVRNIPIVYGIHEDKAAMLTSWHEGSNPTSINENISILLVQFVKELVILSPQSDFFERASESICDNSQVIKSLTKRMMLAESSSIKHEFPLLQKELSLRTQKYLKFLISFKIDFSSNYILSPSDFGIHNLLLSNQGRHIFYDFEFFGFDRPEKLLIDTLIHPRNYWEIESITSFTSYFIENDLYSEEICQTFAPYSVLNWMYILLKRFSNQSMGLLDRSENTPEGRTEPRDVLLEIELLLDLFDNLIANKGDNLATLVAFALDKSQWRRGEIK